MRLAVVAAAAIFSAFAASAAEVANDTNAVPRKVEMDFTRLSKIVRQAQVTRFLESPEKYVGKIVQISGDFYVDKPKDGEPGRYACALKDAAGCCAIGEVEFRPRGAPKWPQDFPDEYDTITVNGKVEIMRNGDGVPCPRLVEADIVRKK